MHDQTSNICNQLEHFKIFYKEILMERGRDEEKGWDEIYVTIMVQTPAKETQNSNSNVIK